MAVATIKLVDNQYLKDFYFTTDPTLLAQRMLREGKYAIQGTIGVPELERGDVAEEIFDLTNNPSRSQERADLYGPARSVSVGDIVNVDGADWLCCALGWWRL